MSGKSRNTRSDKGKAKPGKMEEPAVKEVEVIKHEPNEVQVQPNIVVTPEESVTSVIVSEPNKVSASKITSTPNVLQIIPKMENPYSNIIPVVSHVPLATELNRVGFKSDLIVRIYDKTGTMVTSTTSRHQIGAFTDKQSFIIAMNDLVERLVQDYSGRPIMDSGSRVNYPDQEIFGVPPNSLIGSDILTQVINNSASRGQSVRAAREILRGCEIADIQDEQGVVNRYRNNFGFVMTNAESQLYDVLSQYSIDPQSVVDINRAMAYYRLFDGPRARVAPFDNAIDRSIFYSTKQAQNGTWFRLVDTNPLMYVSTMDTLLDAYVRGQTSFVVNVAADASSTLSRALEVTVTRASESTVLIGMLDETKVVPFMVMLLKAMVGGTSYLLDFTLPSLSGSLPMLVTCFLIKLLPRKLFTADTIISVDNYLLANFIRSTRHFNMQLWRNCGILQALTTNDWRSVNFLSVFAAAGGFLAVDDFTRAFQDFVVTSDQWDGWGDAGAEVAIPVPPAANGYVDRETLLYLPFGEVEDEMRGSLQYRRFINMMRIWPRNIEIGPLGGNDGVKAGTLVNGFLQTIANISSLPSMFRSVNLLMGRLSLTSLFRPVSRMDWQDVNGEIANEATVYSLSTARRIDAKSIISFVSLGRFEDSAFSTNYEFISMAQAVDAYTLDFLRIYYRLKEVFYTDEAKRKRWESRSGLLLKAAELATPKVSIFTDALIAHIKLIGDESRFEIPGPEFIDYNECTWRAVRIAAQTMVTDSPIDFGYTNAFYIGWNDQFAPTISNGVLRAHNFLEAEPNVAFTLTEEQYVRRRVDQTLGSLKRDAAGGIVKIDMPIRVSIQEYNMIDDIYDLNTDIPISSSSAEATTYSTSEVRLGYVFNYEFEADSKNSDMLRREALCAVVGTNVRIVTAAELGAYVHRKDMYKLERRLFVPTFMAYTF